MNKSSERSTSHRCNVLALDGGGVRGLSSLLILQNLMQYVNETIRNQRRDEETCEDVEPRDVFDFVAGTSTGGLIAIMLGKLGMTLGESIRAYYVLSKSIFGKKHVRGRITHGLAPTRYSGSRLEGLIQNLIGERGFPMTIPMVSDDDRDKIACAVICREHVHQSKYSDFKRGAVPICSLRCHKQVACLVSEAARATSAAPTFFPVQKIGNRYFVDGGMEYNNPSHAIFHHYTQSDRVASPEKTSGMPGAASVSNRHGRLDFSRVRFVNLGTGTKSEVLPPRQRDRLADFVPGFIRMTLFLKRTLTEFAVNSESIADHMHSVAQVSSGNVEYERFSADTGVCYIKMDKYKKLELIEQLTIKYLESPEIKGRLKKVGEDIAIDYLLKRRPEIATESASLTSLTIPVPNAASSQATSSQTPETSEPSTSAAASTSDSCECPDSDTRKDANPLEQRRDFEVTKNSVMSLGIETRYLPTEVVNMGTGSMTVPTMVSA